MMFLFFHLEGELLKHIMCVRSLQSWTVTIWRTDILSRQGYRDLCLLKCWTRPLTFCAVSVSGSGRVRCGLVVLKHRLSLLAGVHHVCVTIYTSPHDPESPPTLTLQHLLQVRTWTTAFSVTVSPRHQTVQTCAVRRYVWWWWWCCQSKHKPCSWTPLQPNIRILPPMASLGSEGRF